MPVLDAKALEVDPKGMAFLESVLRQRSTASRPQPKDLNSRKPLVQNVRLHFRLARRSRQLLSDPA